MYIGCNFTVQPIEPVRDILIAYLEELDFESFEETQQGFKAFIQQSAWDESQVDELVRSLDPDWKIHFEVTEIPLENWNAKWESEYDPIRIGNQCLVRAPFHKPDGAVAYEIVISPKMSFGTGHHETTYLMLNHLIHTDLEGHRVLDMGSGTGVLAIMAIKKGAKEAYAVDIDPWCYENCLENCELNEVSNIQVLQGDTEVVRGMRFEVILANINTNILLAQIPDYTDLLAPGGTLIMSGFYTSDLPAIKKSCTLNGLAYQDHQERNNWVAAIFKN